jgi:hypothetical protein
MNLDAVTDKGLIGINIALGLIAIVFGIDALIRFGAMDQVTTLCAVQWGFCYASYPASLIVFGALSLILTKKFGYYGVLMTFSAAGIFDFTNSWLANVPNITYPIWFLMMAVPLLIVWPKFNAKPMLLYLFGILVMQHYLYPEVITLNNMFLSLPEALEEVFIGACFYFSFSPRLKK